MREGHEVDLGAPRRLFDAAGIRPSFSLGNWAGLLRTLPEGCCELVLAAMEEAPARHRAGADAEQLLEALAAGTRNGD